jgi:hypothetical protein
VKIPSPPYKLPGSNTFFLGIDDIQYLCTFVKYFSDEYFDNRYYSQLEWFKDDIVDKERILNIGCGSGRETFALSWK